MLGNLVSWRGENTDALIPEWGFGADRSLRFPHLISQSTSESVSRPLSPVSVRVYPKIVEAPSIEVTVRSGSDLVWVQRCVTRWAHEQVALLVVRKLPHT